MTVEKYSNEWGRLEAKIKFPDDVCTHLSKCFLAARNVAMTTDSVEEARQKWGEAYAFALALQETAVGGRLWSYAAADVKGGALATEIPNKIRWSVVNIKAIDAEIEKLAKEL
jgi:hypothetical protein